MAVLRLERLRPAIRTPLRSVKWPDPYQYGPAIRVIEGRCKPQAHSCWDVPNQTGRTLGTQVAAQQQ